MKVDRLMLYRELQIIPFETGVLIVRPDFIDEDQSRHCFIEKGSNYYLELEHHCNDSYPIEYLPLGEVVKMLDYLYPEKADEAPLLDD